MCQFTSSAIYPRQSVTSAVLLSPSNQTGGRRFGARFAARARSAAGAAGTDRGGQGHAGHAGAAFGTAAGAAAFVARLFVKLAATHFLLDAAVFHQFSKPAHRLLN